MARQAEPEGDRRAKVIHATGAFEAAENLGAAAEILEAHPAAMQLRVLSTMSEVAADRNSTLVFPVPIELLRFLDTDRAAHQPRTGTRPQRTSTSSAGEPSGNASGRGWACVIPNRRNGHGSHPALRPARRS
jgi:hypothetical protein